VSAAVWLAAVVLLLAPVRAAAWTPGALFGPCEGKCATAFYLGTYVEDSMSDLSTSGQPPTTWDYGEDDHFVGTALSREVAQFWRHWTIEPEVGIGQRFGRQSATEVWGAFYFRYHGFPWDHVVLTTAALSTGINWASEVTEVEQDRARDEEGSQLMHYFSPEITFARPSHPDVEFLIRFHHRSGVFGLISDAWGGAQYLSAGIRVRF
jgi:hypothetical protein